MNVATPQLNNDDLELLSAYIDSELTDTERTQLEARLQQEPALRNALAELRTTVEAVRTLPPMRPPRSFTLDPNDARVRSARVGGGVLGWLRALQMAGGVAAVVLLGALSLTFTGGGMVGAPMPAAAPEVRQAPAPAVEAQPTAELEMLQAAPAPAATQPPADVASLAAPEATLAPQPTPAPPAASVANEAAPATADEPPVKSTDAPAEAAREAPPVLLAQEDATIATPAISSPDTATMEEAAPYAPESGAQPAANSVSPTSIIAAIAGFIVAAAIGATLWQRRRERRL